MEGQKPETTIRAGSVSATIWKNTIKDANGVEYDKYHTEITKSYPKTKDKTGKVIEWGKSANYEEKELLDVYIVLHKAIEFLRVKE